MSELPEIANLARQMQAEIGYKEGQPCPVCGTPIEKIKTGSTSSFICPKCQPL